MPCLRALDLFSLFTHLSRCARSGFFFCTAARDTSALAVARPLWHDPCIPSHAALQRRTGPLATLMGQQALARFVLQLRRGANVPAAQGLAPLGK